ncbi:unnamed protein product [Effrenium voratum]|nr:unnamed protein product [Effrenium voratum]CAJ1446802.1 unnamed protein product [Effrenium voratum]
MGRASRPIRLWRLAWQRVRQKLGMLRPSAELQALSSATAKAVCRADPEGACPICLLSWKEDDSVLVLSCNHVLHVDCFWKMITSGCSEVTRGRCRVCRTPVHWGPVARSNLRCTLGSALAAALVRQQRAGGGLTQFEVAEYCARVSQEIGESFREVWMEVPLQLRKLTARNVLLNSEMANLQRLFVGDVPDFPEVLSLP